MRKVPNLITFSLLLIFVINYAHASKFSDVNKVIVDCEYNSNSDQSQCIQKYIDMGSSKSSMIVFKPGSLLIAKPIRLKSNTDIAGTNTTIKINFDKSYQSAFYADSVNNIKISGIMIVGSGKFLNDTFKTNYSRLFGVKAIGYTNLDKGITIYGSSNKISIDNVKITGVERGIDISNNDINSTNLVSQIHISNSTFSNLGKVAIRLVNCSNVVVSGNKISHILGNMDDSGNANLALAKFADGIYLSGVINAQINNNQIMDVKRIGIVLEGDEINNKIINVNDKVKISNNKIYNVNNCRGTENNAGIWVEASANDDNKFGYKTNRVIISNNLIDNSQNSNPCVHNQYGLFLGGKENIVQNNKISNFNTIRNYAINCNYGTIVLTHNIFINNKVNIFTNPKPYYLNIKNN